MAHFYYLTIFTCALLQFQLSSAIESQPLEFVLPRGYRDWSSCDVGKPFSPRKVNGAGAYMQIFTSLKTQCDGYITEWWFFNIAHLPYTQVHLTVWQRLASGVNHWFLIGYNSFNASTHGWISFQVPREAQIKVRPGYTIGFHYDTPHLREDRLVIPYVDALSGDVDLSDLSSVIIAPYGHFEIIDEMDTNRFISLPYVEMQNSRTPALLAHVVTDVIPQGPTIPARRTIPPPVDAINDNEAIGFPFRTSSGPTRKTTLPTIRPTTSTTKIPTIARTIGTTSTSTTTPVAPRAFQLPTTTPFWDHLNSTTKPPVVIVFPPYYRPRTTPSNWSRAATAVLDAYFAKTTTSAKAGSRATSQSPVCFFPRNHGNHTCAEAIQSAPEIRWFYDSEFSQLCQLFIAYTGICSGNANNFQTQQACADSCERTVQN